MARLVRLQLLVSAQLEGIASQDGIAFSDYLVLGVIRRSPKGRCAPSEVCDTLHRTSGGMTLTLDRLENAGLLSRERDANDRRKVVLKLTASGRALARTVNAALHDWESSLAVSGPRKQALLNALDDLTGVLDGAG